MPRRALENVVDNLIMLRLEGWHRREQDSRRCIPAAPCHAKPSRGQLCLATSSPAMPRKLIFLPVLFTCNSQA